MNLCPKCGGKGEPLGLSYICTECGHEWRGMELPKAVVKE